MNNIPDMPPALPPGRYQRLVTEALRHQLDELDPERTRYETRAVDPAEAHATFARHVGAIVQQVLLALSHEDRLAVQTKLANELLASLSDRSPTQETICLPPAELLQVRELTLGAAMDPEIPAPLVALGASDLLVNARGEPGLAQNLEREIPSADEIDLLCAFVRWYGLRVLEVPLREHCRAGKPLRVITSVYTGSTERKALDWLAKLGAQIRVSYDTRTTRLHAKAWLFKRDSGYSTAFIGSSNLSKSALLDGVEWNVRLSQVTTPHVLDKFAATFESYWLAADYESYDPSREQDRDRLDQALAIAGGDGTPPPLEFFLDVQPWPHQSEMLARIEAERVLHDRHKNLVVAATGTGKTIVAALDYQRLRRAHGDPSLLFVAHRKEILEQSLSAFRQVLREGDFGELYVDGQRPDKWRHVFASVQSLRRIDLADVAPEAFDVVIVDEFHHAAAPTYRCLLEHLRPQELLGLTATPDRADGESVTAYFDDKIAVELRLWDALERGLLCPFQYFGISDGTDLSSVKWSRRGYDMAELENLYTASDARAALVLKQIGDKLRDPARMRALGFCVSVEHARFMAKKFCDAGLPSVAVHANSHADKRSRALAGLRRGKLRALFAVDIFNEGIDLPTVDTLLFLRPTESPVVYMQQLGRGLRLSPDKDCVTVLDFIGQAHRSFRFDLRYRAITGDSRAGVQHQVEQGFPFLPAGCTMQLDRVAQQVVLDNLKNALPLQWPRMVRELRDLADSDEFRTRQPSLRDFLAASGLELNDVYRSRYWSALKREAGLGLDSPGPHEAAIGKAIGRLLHTDDVMRFRAYERVLAQDSERDLADPERRLFTGLYYTLLHKVVEAHSIDEAIGNLHKERALVSELQEVLKLLEESTPRVTFPLDMEMGWDHEIPLSVHAHYSTDEILAAFGLTTIGKPGFAQVGIFRDQATNSDIFLVTLVKSERDYSPTTRYLDYAMSPTHFHWESQSAQAQSTPAVQRYINHASLGGHVFLFVRHRKTESGRTVPYTFLGPADHVSHQGNRPVQFVWRLRRPMPADFYREAKVVGG